MRSLNASAPDVVVCASSVGAVLGSGRLRTDDESIVPTGQTLDFKIAHALRF